MSKAAKKAGRAGSKRKEQFGNKERKRKIGGLAVQP